MHKRILVVGGGLGGLTAAIRLARMGFSVSLFEKNSEPGGKMNRADLGNYQFDTGPSLLTMPFVIDELMDFAGYKREDLLQFREIEPLCRYFFADGSRLDASAKPESMMDAIANISPGDDRNFERFMEYSRTIYELTADIFLYKPIHEIRKILNWNNIKKLSQLWKIDPFRSVHGSVNKFFQDQRLVQLFDRYATYNGSNPFDAPATLNIIPYVEYGLGGFYIKGGMYRLVESLERIARDLGVEIRTNAEVEQIVIDRGEVQGIRVNNEYVPADYVVCNADTVRAHQSLLPESRQSKKYDALEPSLSGMVFLWGMNREFPELAHHNILFSDDYREEFRQIFEELAVPDDPTVYIAITSKTDPSHAPDGGENWFVLLNMPYTAEGQRWEKETHRMREAVMNRLQKFDIDVRDSIAAENVITPLDFQSRYGANRGSIYGISSNNRSAAFNRPANRSRKYKGLYFASGSAHPGGGIPLVMLSGKMASELIAEEEGIDLEAIGNPSMEPVVYESTYSGGNGKSENPQKTVRNLG